MRISRGAWATKGGRSRKKPSRMKAEERARPVADRTRSPTHPEKTLGEDGAAISIARRTLPVGKPRT